MNPIISSITLEYQTRQPHS